MWKRHIFLYLPVEIRSLKREQEIYRGKKIVIDIPGEHENHGNHVHLSIDDRDIHVMKLSTGKYSSHYLPYYKFPSLSSLAKALIDRIPLFTEGSRR